jgi:hypothetical protein
LAGGNSIHFVRSVILHNAEFMKTEWRLREKNKCTILYGNNICSYLIVVDFNNWMLKTLTITKSYFAVFINTI